MASTLDWLRGRSDDDLAALFAARPDVLMPPPPNLAALARRLDSDAAARRVMSRCDAFEWQIVQAVWLVSVGVPRGYDAVRGGYDAVRGTSGAGGPRPAAVSTIAAILGGPATEAAVGEAAARLETIGVLHSDKADNETGGYLVPSATVAALGRFPGGLGDAAGLAVAEVAEALEGIDQHADALLRRLVPGPPVGTVGPESDQRDTVDTLLAAVLLTREDARTVMLPREVALVMRGEHPFGAARAKPPELATTSYRAGVIDATAGGQALAARAHAAAIIDALGAAPAAALKSGGIGIVALRGLAKRLDLETVQLALYLELLHAGGMIAPALSAYDSSAAWMPTREADAFLHRSEESGCAELMLLWLDMRRDPAVAGSHDDDGKVRHVLSAALDRRGAPLDRRRVLTEIAYAPADSGAASESVAARLAYRQPGRGTAGLTTMVDAVIAEATELGIVAFNGLSHVGRLPGMITADPAHPEVTEELSTDAVMAAVEAMLPKPVTEVMIQADMTMVVPGRPARKLAAFFARVAEVESAGSATVYRLTEASVRRALDAGFTHSEIHELLASYAANEIPQSVTYLIDDVARQHGVLRVGAASAFVHSEDPAVITQAIGAARQAGIPLRTLAPTVAMTPMDASLLVDVLRSAGLTPAAEDADGTIVDLAPEPQRARTPAPIPRPPTPTVASAEQIATIVSRMRATDGSASAASDPADVVSLLRSAASARGGVWITYADTDGSTSTRMVEPVVVSRGTMVAHDRLRDQPRTFVLHRISSAYPDSESGT